MESNLKITLDRTVTPWSLHFNGSLDESSVFPEFDLREQTEVRLDLSKLQGLSSSGLLKWAKWIASLPASPLFVFQKCPEFFAVQIGGVTGLLPARATITSFFVPYYDASRDELERIEFTLGKQFTDKELLLPAFVKSEETRKVLELDVDPKKFFAFLKKFFPKILLP